MIDPTEVVWLGEIMDQKIAEAFAARGHDISHAMVKAGLDKLKARQHDIWYEQQESVFQEIAIEVFRAMMDAKA